jgi:Na+-translocating ferredoxin:NAD+ oxidoreductase RnfD subunit
MAAPALSTASPAPKKWSLDSRFIAPLFISVLLLTGHLMYRMLEDWRKTALCIIISILTEVILGLIVTKKVPHLASAYVSGISAGILTRCSSEWWPYVLVPMIAITSKYVIRYKGRHLWNPTNFAIAVAVLLAHDTIGTLSIQWGNDLLPILIIWALGAFIVYRIRRLHISLTYIAAFAFFGLVRALITHGSTPLWETFLREISPITGPMYQLFIFFMITDPKTTTLTKGDQIRTALLIAFTEFMLRLGGTLGWFPGSWSHIPLHAPYYALFLIGPFMNYLEIRRTANKPKND